MKVSDVIKKLRVMLAEETPVVTEEVVKEEMAEETLVDGTIVYAEGEIAPGAVLKVRVGEAASTEDPFAPEGIHETTSGLLITVNADGTVATVEAKPAEVTARKQKMAEEMPIEEVVKKEVEMSLDDILLAIAEILKPYLQDMTEVKEEITTLESRFNRIANEPGARKISANFKAERDEIKSVAEARFEKLVQLRKSGTKLN